MALTFDTLNSLTEQFWVEKTMQDTVMRGTPTLDYLKKYQRAAGGLQDNGLVFDLEYARLGGGSRAKGGAMTLTTPEIITKGRMGWREYFVPISLYQEDIDANESDPRKFASFLNRYVRSALQTMREKHLAVDIFKAQAGNALDSIVDAVSDSATYAGIAKADIASWRAVTAEAVYTDTPDSPVSPSLGNFRRMIRAINNVSGEKPQLIVTSPEVWDRLADQIDANDVIMAAGNANHDVVKWGYDALWISGVPVIDDLNFAEANCSAFVNGGSRAADNGHEALFLNFKYLYPVYIPGRNMTWDKSGWMSAIDNTNWVNKLHFWGNIICTNRRAQGRFYGIDPTQATASFTDVVIDTSPYVVV